MIALTPMRARLLRGTVVFVVAFLASYAILHGIVVEPRGGTDFGPHLAFTRRLLTEDVVVPAHPLFHLVTAAISYVSGAVVEQSALILTAGSIGASAVIIDELFLSRPGAPAGEDAWIRALLVFAALIATALYLPRPHLIYVGQSSPTIWHNPTGMLLKPFALLAAIHLERIVFDRERWPSYAITVVAVVVGMLAKPAFALVLIPIAGALVLYMSLPARWQFLPEDQLPSSSHTRNFLFVLGGIAALVLLAQGVYIFMYDRAWSRIIFAPLVVWSRQSFNIPRSILLAIAFPLAVVGLDLYRRIPLRGFALAWGFVISGAAVFLLFAEAGRLMLHGNFSWGYQVSLSILFAFAVRSYLRHWRERRRTLGFVAVSALLAAHAMSGVYYVHQIVARHDFR